MRRVAAAAVSTALAMALTVGIMPAAHAATTSDPVGDKAKAAADDLVRQGFPGAVLYLREGTVTRTAAAGVSDTANGRAADPRQRFRIASNTKAFTATVLLQLVAERRLSISDTVDGVLPGLLGPDGARITVRQLLDHTSGLHDPASTPEFFAPYLQDGDRAHVIEPREVIRQAVAHGQDFPPGERTEYTNTGYLVAGLLIEAITGHPADVEIDRRLLRPLGLRDTSMPLRDAELHGDHLHGYQLDGQDMTRFSPSYDWTAGAMVSTVDDLARFQRALLAGELLPPREQLLLREVSGGHYGLGVETGPLPCPGGTQPMWGNTGAGPGYYSMSMTSADGERQVVFAVNSYDLGADVRGEDKLMPGDPFGTLPRTLCP